MAASGSEEALLAEWSVVGGEINTAPSEPRAAAPLRTELALERDAFCMDAGELKAVLSVVAPPALERDRAPLRLVAVLDKSGSMNGPKLHLVKQTMLCMLRHLSERDALGIVEYASKVKVTAPLTRCSQAGRAKLESALKLLKATDQTNLSGGLLRGIDLHQRGVQEVEDISEERQVLQRIRLGNTYKRLTQEESEERGHYGHPDAALPEGAARIHEWTMELRFDNPEDEAQVDKVVYHLHSTFRERSVEVKEAPFRLTRHGWGTFQVGIRVILKDGRVHHLTHELSFDSPESFRSVLLPLHMAPPGFDFMCNREKMLCVTSLERDGRKLQLKGVPYNTAWGISASSVELELPEAEVKLGERIQAMFEGEGDESQIEFMDGDTPKMFLVPEGRRRKAPKEMEEDDKSLVRATFLFTDGMANVGITNTNDICAASRAALSELGDKECKVSTFGFGTDHNAELLQRLAEEGKGLYSFIESEDKISEAFGELLGGLLSTTHQNVSLSLSLPPGVTLARAYTTFTVEPKPPATGSVSIDLEDLYAEERRDILLSINLPAADTEGPQVLGQFEAKGFSVLGRCTETTPSTALTVNRRPGVGKESSRHPQVERHWNRQLAMEALERGRAAAQGGNLGFARQLLAEAREAVGTSSLTYNGDEASLRLVLDLEDCERDLCDHKTYTGSGSKKMAMMRGAHGKQRAAYGQEFSKAYTNDRMKVMSDSFKMACS